ncbi:MAG TPA: L,D-transpeptidase family protein [Chthoniobacterales bacterium]
MMRLNRQRIFAVFAFFITVGPMLGQGGLPSPVRGHPPQPPARIVAAPPPVQMRKASELIHRQDPIRINQKLLNSVSPSQVHVVVSLPKQRAYLLMGDEIVIDSPISSGKRGHTSPSGSFSVLEKDPDHHSSIYGDFVDRSGRTVRAGVSAKIDSAPSGTHFDGASMKWFMRLTDEGVGMHVGILPGYAASHGCIRMPPEGAKLFYDHVKVGTPVRVAAEG